MNPILAVVLPILKRYWSQLGLVVGLIFLFLAYRSSLIAKGRAEEMAQHLRADSTAQAAQHAANAATIDSLGRELVRRDSASTAQRKRLETALAYYQAHPLPDVDHPAPTTSAAGVIDSVPPPLPDTARVVVLAGQVRACTEVVSECQYFRLQAQAASATAWALIDKLRGQVALDSVRLATRDSLARAETAQGRTGKVSKPLVVVVGALGVLAGLLVHH